MNKRRRINDERVARTDRILDGAETLFVEKGYLATSIQDIADQADFSRTSVYQYFKNKEEVYACILERYTDSLINRVTVATNGSLPASDKIRAFVYEMHRMAKDKPNFFRLYFIQRHQLEPRLSLDMKTRLNKKRKQLENVFRNFYRDGVKKSEVRNIRAKDASNLFFAQIMGMLLLHEYYDEEFDVSLDGHFDKSLQLYLEFVENKD
jgi:AcrR family transcriptional regulator